MNFKMKNFILFLKNLLIYFGLYKLEYNFSSTINFGSKKANKFFMDLIKKSKFVYEYGSGNSTLFMKKNKVKYVSIESKKDIFVKLKKKNLNIFFFSLGITKRYSIPYFLRLKKKKIINYANSINILNIKNPDLILIDGRFRVICFFYIMNYLRSKKLNNTVVIIDDFNRKEYSIINSYFKIKCIGRIGYLKLNNQIKKYDLKKIEKKYLFDPS